MAREASRACGSGLGRVIGGGGQGEVYEAERDGVAVRAYPGLVAVDAGAAVLVPQSELTPVSLAQLLRGFTREQLLAMAQKLAMP